MKCERCGKAVSNVEWDIHTCTPPAQPQQEPVASKPCRSPYCECDVGKCSHPGFYDARHEEFTPPAQPAPVQEPLMVDVHPPATRRDHWMYEQGRLAERDPRSHTTPPAEPVKDLPFGVGGGLVAIKTLLSRDPCVHANTAIEMVDAILKGHPAAQPPLQDIPDLIAGAFGVSRGTAYDLMRDALKEASPAAQPATEESSAVQPVAQPVWLPVTKELLAYQPPWIYKPMWIAMKHGERLIQGYYEWQQGRYPDRFLTDIGNVWAFDATHVMPIVQPEPPAIEAAHGIKGGA